MAPVGFSDKVTFVWKVADKLRGTFKPHEYGSVMLPLLVLRRMDAVLAPTREAVLDQAVALGALKGDRKTLGKSVDEGVDLMLKRTAGQRFYSLSPLTFTAMLQNDKERSAPDRSEQRDDGLHLRGTPAEVLRDEQRDRW